MPEINWTELSNIPWHFIHKRPRTPMYLYSMWHGASHHLNEKLSFPYEASDFIYLDSNIGISEREWKRMGELSWKEFEKDPGYLQKNLNDCYALNDEIESFCRSLEHIDFSQVSREELTAFWETYNKLTVELFSAYLLLPLFIESQMEESLKHSLNTLIGEEGEKAFQILTTPLKEGITQLSEKNLLRMAIRKELGEDIEGALDQYIRDYAWTKNNSFDGKFYTRAEIIGELDKIRAPKEKLEALIAKENELRLNFKKFYEKLGVREKQVVDALQESIYFRSWRTERYYRNAYFLQNFFHHTERLLGLGEGDIFYLTQPEVIGFLKNSNLAPQETVKERRKGFGVLTDRKTTYIFTGQVLKDAIANIPLLQAEVAEMVRGQVAYLGKATGPAVITIDKSELHKVKEGDILITTSTTVDFVPFLKKIRAIVADEGGVLSHASVISRELHIPCVIGTRVGTKSFKDGDMVEVDAEKGIVRKI